VVACDGPWRPTGVVRIKKAKGVVRVPSPTVRPPTAAAYGWPAGWPVSIFSTTSCRSISPPLLLLFCIRRPQLYRFVPATGHGWPLVADGESSEAWLRMPRRTPGQQSTATVRLMGSVLRDSPVPSRKKPVRRRRLFFPCGEARSRLPWFVACGHQTLQPRWPWYFSIEANRNFDAYSLINRINGVLYCKQECRC
jgi:hypothetical protein